MTGLEKIIEHIREESVDEANKILADAQAEADDIMAAAREECSKLAAELKAHTDSEAELARQRGDSAAALAKRKMLLQAKQQIISDVLAKSKDSLLKLPDKVYFDTILRMIKKYAHGQEGEVMLSPADLKRMPENFGNGLAGTSLKLSSETRDIDGGFVLLYGDIEENCSFDAIFSAEKEVLQDKIRKLLFDNAG